MKLTAYQKVITMAKEKVEEAMAPIRAKQMRKKGELELAQIEEQILQKEATVTELASKYPIDYKKVLDSIDDLDLLKMRKAQFEKVLDQLFPTEE